MIGLKSSPIMYVVSLALLPGIAAMSWVWGIGVISNCLLALTFCLSLEALMLYLRGASLRHLIDGSVIVTALLIAICLPPGMPWWILAIASLFAVGLAKHLYGGVGRNLFNPAMVGYAIVLVSYPEVLNQWPAATNTSTDGFSGATLLTEFRYRSGLTTSEFGHAYLHALDRMAFIGYAFAAGGITLLLLRIIHWRIPLAICVGLCFAALFGYDQGSSQSLGSPLFHIVNGGLVAAIFFVATDPITHPHSSQHQWLFGILIGLLVYCMRGFAAYPDGIAFAILLANAATPLLNRYHAHSLAKSAEVK